jgi:hypothetical protein
MHAAVAAAMAPAEPEVTMPDSAPVSSARRRSNGALKFKHIYEILRTLQAELAALREIQGSAEIGPGTTAVDDRLYA